MTTWFTADHHFGHARSIAMNGRPFADVVEMREAMIDRWNSTVRPDDDVWHLGDFAYRADGAEVERIFGRLNGRKHLIVGNHDGQAVQSDLNWHLVAQIKQIAVDGHRVIMCHYPMLEWPGYFRQSIHLFGHVHGNRRGVGKSCDVGVDAWGYRPVGLADVLERIGDAQNT